MQEKILTSYVVNSKGEVIEGRCLFDIELRLQKT
jgi:hypothetical protein